MSRLVSPREQAVPPAGGCCVTPLRTITRSLTTSHTKFHRSFPCRDGWEQRRKEGKEECGYRAGEKENETFTVVLSLVNQDTLSSWPLQKGVFCKICFPAQTLGLHPVIMCTCPCCVFSLNFRGKKKKNLKTKKTSPHIHPAQCQACS